MKRREEGEQGKERSREMGDSGEWETDKMIGKRK